MIGNLTASQPQICSQITFYTRWIRIYFKHIFSDVTTMTKSLTESSGMETIVQGSRAMIFTVNTIFGTWKIILIHSKINLGDFFPYKVWVKKNVTHIALNFSNLDCFSEKSFKSSKNTHAKDLKMVRQVNIVKKLPPGIMIKYKIHFWENTNFVKKEFAKKVILHLWVSCKLCLL